MTEADPLIGTVVGKYRIIANIGSGSFATVYRAQHTVTLTSVALKSISKQSVLDPTEFELLQREINLMKSMDHPLVNLLYEVIDDDRCFYLVVELVARGSLLTFIRDAHSLGEAAARRVFFQLVTVLEYLHMELRIAHRDIKPENVLLDANLNIRVADFGLARAFTASNPFLQTTCGSPSYIAPEILEQKPYTAAADIWSAGTVLYAMVTGRVPFWDYNISVMFQNILTIDPVIPPDLSPFLRDLITRCLIKDPRLRITLLEIRNHAWLSEVQDLRLLEEDAEIIRSLKVMNVKKLDEGILSEMKMFEYDTAGLLQEVQGGTINGRTAVYKMLKRERTIDEIQHWQAEREAKAEALAAAHSPVHRISLAEKSPMTRSQEPSVGRPDLAIPRIPTSKQTKYRARQRPAPITSKRKMSPLPPRLAPLPDPSES
jgi:serine/threonine protein kinase